MDEEMLLQYLLQMIQQQGFDPAALGLAGLGQMPGEINKYGEAEPYDVGTFAKQGNALQDYLAILGDPMLGAMTGEGGYDPRDFAPVEDKRETFDAPRRDLFESYLAMNPESLEHRIALAVESGKFSPREIVKTASTSETPIDPADVDYYNKLAETLFAENAKYKADGAALPRDADGQSMLERVTYKDSDATKFYRDQGLPTPNERYLPDDFGGNAEGTERLRGVATLAAQAVRGGEAWKPTPTRSLADIQAGNDTYANDQAARAQSMREYDADGNRRPAVDEARAVEGFGGWRLDQARALRQADSVKAAAVATPSRKAVAEAPQRGPDVTALKRARDAAFRQFDAQNLSDAWASGTASALTDRGRTPFSDAQKKRAMFAKLLGYGQ